MNSSLGPRATVWQIILWACLAIEGLWFFLAFKLAPAPYPLQLWLMLLLWLLVAGSSVAFRDLPALVVIAAIANLIGTALLKSRPGGIAHPWLWFLYYRSIDLLIVIAAFAIWTIRKKRIVTR